jgi:hypothetical protein
MNKTTVVLQIFKGQKISYDEQKNVQNENQEMTLTYGDIAWKQHLNNLRLLGLCKVEVKKVYDGENEIEVSQELKDEVQKAFLNVKEAVLTPDQKRIADLEAKLEALTNGKTPVVEEVNLELLDLKKQYFAKHDKEVPKNKSNDVSWIKSQLV